MEKRRIIYNKEYLTHGSEGKIYYVDDGLFKEFGGAVSLKKRWLKEKRLGYLDKIDYLKKYYPQIYYYVDSLLGLCLRGYVMEPISGRILSTIFFDTENVIEMLRELKKIIESFRNEGFYYFDIREPNVRVRDGKPMLLDIDGIIMDGERKLDATPLFIAQYLEMGGKLDSHAQILMFNSFTRICLGQYAFENEIKCDKVGLEIMQADEYVDTVCDHEYLVDHIKMKTKKH